MRFRFFLYSLSFMFVYLLTDQSLAESQPLEQINSIKKNDINAEESPTVITADTVTAKEGQTLEATGDAELRKDDQLIRAQVVVEAL